MFVVHRQILIIIYIVSFFTIIFQIQIKSILVTGKGVVFFSCKCRFEEEIGNDEVYFSLLDEQFMIMNY